MISKVVKAKARDQFYRQRVVKSSSQARWLIIADGFDWQKAREIEQYNNRVAVEVIAKNLNTLGLSIKQGEIDKVLEGAISLTSAASSANNHQPAGTEEKILPLIAEQSLQVAASTASKILDLKPGKHYRLRERVIPERLGGGKMIKVKFTHPRVSFSEARLVYNSYDQLVKVRLKHFKRRPRRSFRFKLNDQEALRITHNRGVPFIYSEKGLSSQLLGDYELKEETIIPRRTKRQEPKVSRRSKGKVRTRYISGYSEYAQSASTASEVKSAVSSSSARVKVKKSNPVYQLTLNNHQPAGTEWSLRHYFATYLPVLAALALPKGEWDKLMPQWKGVKREELKLNYSMSLTLSQELQDYTKALAGLFKDGKFQWDRQINIRTKKLIREKKLPREIVLIL